MVRNQLYISRWWRNIYICNLITAIGLGLFIFARDTSSPIFFFACVATLFGCFLGQRNINLTVVWLIALLLSVTLIAPFEQSHVLYHMEKREGFIGAKAIEFISGTQIAILMILCLFPIVSMTMTKATAKLCLCIIYVLSLVLIWQYFFMPELMYNGRRASWPFINPNNAAALINIMFVPLVCNAVRRRSIVLTGLSVLPALAIFLTGSKAAILAAGICIVIYLAITYKNKLILLSLVPFTGVMYFMFPKLISAFRERFPVWEGSMDLVSMEGTGIGTFYRAYSGQPIKEGQIVFFAHNDYYQLFIEMGLIASVILLVVFNLLLNTNKNNLMYALGMFSILLHSVVSYPLYVPSISIGMGILYYLWWENGKSKRDNREAISFRPKYGNGYLL